MNENQINREGSDQIFMSREVLCLKPGIGREVGNININNINNINHSCKKKVGIMHIEIKNRALEITNCEVLWCLQNLRSSNKFNETSNNIYSLSTPYNGPRVVKVISAKRRNFLVKMIFEQKQVRNKTSIQWTPGSQGYLSKK